MHSSGSSVPAVSSGYSKVNDNVSPVVIGTKMVERVINMRKLAPPRQDGKNSPQGNPGPGGKSSSPDSLGFGRTLSKKSLDMAIRHMISLWNLLTHVDIHSKGTFSLPRHVHMHVGGLL
ncbi:hypothetical protein EZV62_026021 [Acer yangbiense]|uniref:Uncharacterized protein n=1 Tax=Acer yangbiense TaxID=1000413 RepID=A0A5C7H1H4_9ROSI|nr:hypothetical protein EZV62_026021 [Acer yangbiense]